MAKHHIFLHIGPDLVDVDGDVRERLAAAGVLTPDVTDDHLHHADLEIRRAHRAAGLRRKEVEGAWAKVCRRTFRLKSHAFISQPGFVGADADQAALALDSLAGLKVHLVRTQAELPLAWERLVKPGRIHTIEPGLTSAGFADELARIVRSQEEARLDRKRLKQKLRRKQADLAA